MRKLKTYLSLWTLLIATLSFGLVPLGQADTRFNSVPSGTLFRAQTWTAFTSQSPTIIYNLPVYQLGNSLVLTLAVTGAGGHVSQLDIQCTTDSQAADFNAGGNNSYVRIPFTVQPQGGLFNGNGGGGPGVTQNVNVGATGVGATISTGPLNCVRVIVQFLTAVTSTDTATLTYTFAPLQGLASQQGGPPTVSSSSPYSYTKITTNASTQIKTSAGVLQSLIVSSPGSAWTIQIFDNTACSGTAIFGATAVTVPAAATVVTFNTRFNLGLCVITAGTTPGEITITSW